VIYQLSKLGFTQSYNYFPWRNTKTELEAYFTELTSTTVREYFRANLWPNTPDILTEYLQYGGRPAFMLRLVLAATLGASYGIYGPAYELLEATSKAPESEEYLNSEKYQIRHWDVERADSLKDFITRVNKIRRDNPALQQDQHLHFMPVDNDNLLCYAKIAEVGGDIMLIVANLDPQRIQAGWVTLQLELLGLDNKPYQMHDLLTGARFLWNGAKNYVELNPLVTPVHIFKLRCKVRTEHDFDYFL
jgi:starch synthase (maltosyl-transferring)